ncbi:RNA-directed DNA polymerase, eukaryota, reverse transcriptase zinc-binding domain protein [Tanacetum coccineum]
MNCFSINVQGLGDLNKRRWIRDLCHRNMVNLLAIQESKMSQVNLWVLRQLWGNSQFDFASSSARGMSGGIISIWNCNIFLKSNIMCNDNYVVVDGRWVPGNLNIRWINVYAPQNLSSKIALWSSLSNLIVSWDGIVVVMGDYNEVRDASERFGSIFIDRQAKLFNKFIEDSSLIDIPLGGYNFTWTDKWGSKMSKLDRFLVSDKFYEYFPNITGVILEKGIPDHRPILLKESHVEIKDIDSFSFKKKLQHLKNVICGWLGSKKAISLDLKNKHLDQLSSIDVKVDLGIASEEDFKNRRDSLMVLGDLERVEVKDIAQKARIKWALEGDKNTSFFHGMLKKKRRQLAIKGILKNGDWIENPSMVKAEFLGHFSSRFQQPNGIPPSLDSKFLNPISPSKREFLERPFSRGEIKKAVWDCGGDRAPGPDGFTFKFFTTFWDLIEDDVIRFVHEYFRTNLFPKGCNFSFIALIPKGLHALTCKAEALGLFKGVTIGRDNLSISHLMYADDAIFFGDWSWINAQNLISMLRCFFLISGLQINIHKSSVLGVGVHEAEVTHMANIIGCGAAKFPLKYLGVPVGCNMARCLNWNVRFSLSFSLITVFRGKPFIRMKLESMRNKFFIGGDPVEKKLTWDKCLASKREGGLGIGSIFGLNIGFLFKWFWIFFCDQSDLWIRVIKSIHGPGGGINSDTNTSLKRSTWGSILSSINSLKSKGIDLFSYCTRKIGNGMYSSFWSDLWCGNQPLKVMFPCIFLFETDKQCSIASRVGLIDWSSVLRRVPRGGEESSQFNALLSVIGSTSLSDQCDVWQWSLNGLSSFSVASVRHLVDSWLLDTCNDATRWNRLLPIKVNVFLWRLNLNKLPSRVNLDRRGIDVIWITCPSCQGDLETVNHTFFNCGLAKELWSLLAKWWDLDIPMCGNIAEWHAWLGDLHVSSKVRLAIEGVGGTLLWSIWNFRNNLIFSSTPPKKSMIWDSVVSQSFLWISSRNPKCKISWIGWLYNPIATIISM